MALISFAVAAKLICVFVFAYDILDLEQSGIVLCST